MAALRVLQDVLPTELWENILALLPSDADLVAYALVCHTFTHLAVRLHLERHGFAPETFVQESLYLSAEALRGLAYHIAPTCLPLREMRCVVGGREELMRQTRAIQTLAGRSKDLRRIDIEFQVDPFLAPVTIRQTILDQLCATLADLAQRVSGPVFVVLAGEIFSCTAKDLLNWKLYAFRYHDAISWLSRFHRTTQTQEDTEYPRDFRITRYHDGDVGSLPTLRQLHSVTLELVPAAEESSTPFSILTFNASDMIYFRLARWHSGGHPSVEPHLKSLLSHLVLPELRALCVYSESLDPSALQRFLAAHTKLEMLDYHAPVRDWLLRRYPAPMRSLIEPTLAHPNLNTIRICTSHFRTSAGHILGDLVMSPGLTFVEILFSKTTRGERAVQMLEDLRGLAKRPVSAALPTVTLNLVDSLTFRWDIAGHYRLVRRRLRPAAGDGDGFWASSQAALDIASTLHCVTTVWVAPLNYATARAMVPWLARLPALVHVSFGFTIKYLDRLDNRTIRGVEVPGIKAPKKPKTKIEEEVRAFMEEEIKKGLPQVHSIVHVVWD
ncbi:hypothetical protein C8F01DRAFT_1174861 [Mycena amicta]|nr:hypothetical protein C8F01DRAFT_1174861 [Mycena amicta]